MKQLADAVPPGEDKQPDQVKRIKRGKDTKLKSGDKSKTSEMVRDMGKGK